MLKVKEPSIKLFGKTITLPSNKAPLAHHDHDHEQSSCSTSEDNKNASGGVLTRSRLQDDSIDPTNAEPIEPATPSGDSETLKTQHTDTDTLSPEVPKKEEQSETSVSQEKTLKKPDKILPCPRCNSMDTKFCYYNNYNVNQPRHFCKNCQRYWTAGGTMRNVPVGSGRRKIKNSCGFNYRHIMFSEALQAAQAVTANSIHLSPLKTDGTFLAFSSERPLCDSKASATNLEEGGPNCVPNGFHGAERRIPVSCEGREHLNGSSSMNLNLIEKEGNAGPQESILKNYQGLTPQVPYYSGTTWPSHLNSAHWTSPASPHSSDPSGFPAATYWCGTVASSWNVPWPSSLPSFPKQSLLSTSPTSSTLGKHSRDESMIKSSKFGVEEPTEEEDLKKSLLLPKTLKMKINNSISAANLFKAFHPKVDEKNHVADTFLILQANPAAFSRSANFREST